MSKPLNPEYFPMPDPATGWLHRHWKWNDWHIIGFIMGLSAVIMLGVGAFASYSYKGPGLGIQSADNIAFIIAWIAIFLPLIWKIYLWQAPAVIALFNQLSDEEIFGKPNTERSQKVSTEAAKIVSNLTRPWVYLLVFLLVIAFWFYEIGYGWPLQFKANGPQYWWEVRWYLPLHLFAWTIGLYAVFALAIRQIFIVYGLSAVFRKFDVSVKVFDPDEAGGLGSVGGYVKTLILFVIGIGVLAALFALEVYMAGANVLERFDVLGLFVIYILLAPLCLIAPTSYVRQAMLRARQQALEPIAAQLRKTLEEAREKIVSNAPDEEIKLINERVAELQKHHDLILQIFPITPVTIRSFRNFSITALLPLISGIITIVLQLLK